MRLATKPINDRANHRKAPVRRETDLERSKRDEMQVGSIWYHIMGKRGKVPNYSKANFIKDPVR